MPTNTSLSEAMNFTDSESTLQIKVDGQTAESWTAILARFVDASIYQTWEYGAVRWGAENLSHLVVRKDGELVAAAQLRIIRLPVLSAGIAYLFWGPLCQRTGQSFDQTVATQIMGALHREYSKRRKLALQIVPNSYIGTVNAAACHDAFREQGLRPLDGRAGYRTIIVDLSPEKEIIRKRLEQKWRNQLNRSEKNGLLFEVNDGRDGYREFAQIYNEMWQRKQFETSVDVEEFGRIHESLSATNGLQVFLAKFDGRTIAALVCSLIGNTAIYLLGATNEKARELKAAYFLQWQAMLWLKERGACYYDLGGIDPQNNPGGYHFKAGFGGVEQTQLGVHVAPGGFLSNSIASLATWRRRRSKAAKPK